jgi:hypothetical protein
VPKLYTLLTDSPDIAVLDEFTERFAIWLGPGMVIDMEAAAAGASKPFMTRQQFCNSYGHRFLESAGKRKLVPDLLFHMPTTTRLMGVTFEPGKGRLVDGADGRKVNQWSGFSVPPWEQPVTADDVAPFLAYLKDVIASGNEVYYDWVLGWVAHIFKEPANKARTALVLVGMPGVGKSFLGEHFLVPLIGPHAVVTNSVDRAIQGFNAIFDNRIFVQCDEALSNRQRQVAARLKSFITDPYLIIEPKGIDPFLKPNHIRLLFTSNELRDAVYLSDGVDDRRYTVLEVSTVQKGKIREFWSPLAKWASDKENLSKLHRFFVDLDYDRAFISTPLQTLAKAVMQEHSMPIFDRWLAAWIARDHPLSEEAHEHWYDAPGPKREKLWRGGWPARINYTALSNDYARFVKQDSSRAILLNPQQIKMEFKQRQFQVGGEQVRIRAVEYDAKKQRNIEVRVYVGPCPAPGEVAKYLEAKYGTNYEFNKDEEESAHEERDEQDEDTEY